MTFGQFLRASRNRRGIGLRAAAHSIGLSASYLSRLEADKHEGAPSEHTVRELARVLQGDADELLRLAGRIPRDVEAIILATPGLFAALRRTRRRKVKSGELVARVGGPPPRPKQNAVEDWSALPPPRLSPSGGGRPIPSGPTARSSSKA